MPVMDSRSGSTADTRSSATAAAAAHPCPYCFGDVPLDAFVPWSPARRLVRADCPACGRRVTVITSTWRSWNQASPATTDRRSTT
jgi:predicted RNA-binding Zn-ribbon protein involved in translation (DUF1610 family)